MSGQKLDGGQLPRRDPREMRRLRSQGARASGTNETTAPPGPPRLDPRTGRRGPNRMARKEADTAIPNRVKKIESPAYFVLVMPDMPDGRLTSHDRDVFGMARGLADAGGGAIIALVADGARDDLGRAGADRVISYRAEAVDGFDPVHRAQALALAAQAYQPRHILLPDSVLFGGDVGRRVAVDLGATIATNVVAASLDLVRRRSRGGRAEQTYRVPSVLLVAPEAADPVSGEVYEARVLDAIRCPDDALYRDYRHLRVDVADVSLSEAEFVVAAGRGVDDWAAFRTVASALGASIGGSRVVVDCGYLPRSHQVGATGQRLSARVYLALGISGAPQHLDGITRCERVIAVNTDRSCEMMKRADVAIIADVQPVLAELAAITERLKS